MQKRLFIFRVALAVLVGMAVLGAGCGVTLSPEKRKPLVVSPMPAATVQNPERIHVMFADVLPGTPLAETVWDNERGPFASPRESVRIGFTQDYVQATLGGPTAMLEPSYTRLFIPFGRVFEEKFRSGLAQAFPQSTVGDPTTNHVDTAADTVQVQLKVLTFEVWEKPLNHINMKAAIECRCRRPGPANQTDTVYVARVERMKQSLGKLPTSGSACRKLEQFVNDISASLTGQILEQLPPLIRQ